MTRIESKALGEIEALMEERQKFERWINSLGERRSITPNHVFQRVLGDYQERMRVVAADLASRAGDIESSIESLRERLGSIQEEETATSDQRAEAELRAAVGEFASDKWEEIRRVADEKIAKLSALRMELTGEMEHLQKILSVAAPKSAPTGSGTWSGDSGRGAAPLKGPEKENIPAPPIAAAPRIDSPPGVAAFQPTRESAGAGASRGSDSFDELAFLSSVVETEISQLSSQPADIRVARSETPEPSVANRAAPTPGTSKIVRSATPLIAESIASGSEGGESAARMGDEPVARTFDRRLSGSVPAYLKDVSKEATKSLKCQECGTMNYPTEWYCERCGGELAAL